MRENALKAKLLRTGADLTTNLPGLGAAKRRPRNAPPADVVSSAERTGVLVKACLRIEPGTHS